MALPNPNPKSKRNNLNVNFNTKMTNPNPVKFTMKTFKRREKRSKEANTSRSNT